MIYTLTSSLRSYTNLSDKKILLRADLNVPLSPDGFILNDHRLHALKQTLSFLVAKNTHIILATHIGRPTSSDDTSLSTKHLIPWFQQHGFIVHHAPDFTALPANPKPQHITLLENMRFYKGETDQDHEFAHQIASLGDYYVNDAFGLLHRHDTSITLVPELFPSHKKTIGFLIEHELAMLNKLLVNPNHPYTLILGGGKMSTKIPLLKALLPTIDELILGPAPVFTFLKAMGKPVGLSMVDDSALDGCREILEEAPSHKVNIHLPIDYQIAGGDYHGPLSYVDADKIPENGIGISIGPKTVQTLSPLISKSHTVFYNGLMGDVATPESLHGVEGIFKAMGRSPGYTVIGGGDSVAAAQQLHCAHRIRFLSTGGGSTLAYLSGASLPGLDSLI